jgi:aryl-alcohol dehydrogenase-like predicted oxidoreductase
MSLDSYVTLGRSGLKVSRFCLGAMTFGKDWGFGADAATAHSMLDLYCDRGGNFVDTANIYNAGNSERIIGEWLRGAGNRREQLVLATKFSGNMHAGNPNGGGANRRSIISACEASLQRLGTDHIDLYWQHWADPFTPVEETMSALDDLVRSGKVRYIGFSDTPAWKTAQAQTIALFRGWAPLIGLQIEYSLLQRTVEGDLVPMAIEMGLGITPWGPLASGMLTGKYDRGKVEAESAGRSNSIAKWNTETTFALLDELRAVACELDTSPARVALAWIVDRRGVASPIIGARTVDQLEDNLAALDLDLPEELVRRLDAASKPTLNFPAEFLPFAVSNTYSGMCVNGQRFEASPR